jgi:hypothetical protein
VAGASPSSSSRRPGAQQAAAVLELLHPGLDQAERERLVRVPAVAVRHKRGPQQVHAGHGGVPPIARALRAPGCHIACLPDPAQ